ncbi:MAG: GDYXXLXY domain-containing protein, partial [Gammaproteobacteria bacterium]|nr:GDYXXLXY domain-containing protein [Gammaproteobacteria bacterium]
MRTGRIRTGLLVAGLVSALAVANYTIYRKQHILDRGQVILLPLRPVDPRSLMQGDYMVLRYAAEVMPDQARRDRMPARGGVVLELDGNRVARFVRADDGSALAPGQVRLRYKLKPKSGELRYGAESF